MKCPKCQYISFDPGDRCRNCGYEFSLSVDMAELDLPIRTGEEALGPMSDIPLAEPEVRSVPPEEEPSVEAGAPGLRPSELPLFRDRGDDDAPLVSLPASPRAPVAVRKSTVTRSAPQRTPFEEPELELDADPAAPGRRAPSPRAGTAPTVDTPAPEQFQTASAAARLLAALVDLALLGAIDIAVLYFTLRLCGLTFSDARDIPVMPFIAFIALLNGGYMAAFTAAGGQTIGKMAARIKVVTMDEATWSDRVPLGQAVLRAAGYLASGLPAGLGFLPGLVGDRRAVHDRLAHTRVVKA